MKTKIWVGVLFYSFMGCSNKAPKSNLTSKLDSTGEAVYFVEDTVVDQSAGLQVIEALSRVYGNDPNSIGGFIGSPRCPSFLEGMFFEVTQRMQGEFWNLLPVAKLFDWSKLLKVIIHSNNL